MRAAPIAYPAAPELKIADMLLIALPGNRNVAANSANSHDLSVGADKWRVSRWLMKPVSKAAGSLGEPARGETAGNA